MDLKQITEDFLSVFKTVNVEVELTDDFYFNPEWTGIEDINDDVMYRSCPIKVDGYNSIANYEVHIKDLENLFLSQYQVWKNDKDKKQIYDINYNIIHLINNVLSVFSIKESSVNEFFKNIDVTYLTNNIYEHTGIKLTFIGEKNHPEGLDYFFDYFPKLSYYIKIQYNSLMRVKGYVTGYNEMLFKIDLPKIHDSFTLKEDIKINLSKTTDLKSYLERKGMIVEENAYDFYRLFMNQKLNKKIQWVKGPGHLKHFIKILKKGQIIETKSLFDIAVKCFEFTGDKYNKKISVEKITHGQIPEVTILNSEILLNFFK